MKTNIEKIVNYADDEYEAYVFLSENFFDELSEDEIKLILQFIPEVYRDMLDITAKERE